MFHAGFEKISNTAADRAKIRAIGNCAKAVVKKTTNASKDIPMRPADVSHEQWFGMLKKKGLM